MAADYSNNSLGPCPHPPITGQKLLADLQRAGNTHPLLRAGFCSGQYKHLETTIEAVNIAIGRQGHEAAYRQLHGRVGIVPDYFWLDTLHHPHR